MAKSVSSKRWLKEHFDDEYVHRAQQEGYRSRAVYKLQEIDESLKLLKKGMQVIDLGAAPGGWTQYVADKVSTSGVVIASDILPMDKLDGVSFIQGDFREESVLNIILDTLKNQQADLVISDMAPNMSGTSADQLRAIYLNELALDLAEQTLRAGGGFVCKIFQGVGSEDYVKQVKQRFAKTLIKKPKASRPRSREVYVVGLNYKA